jgi:hypothetical protein
VQLMEYEAIAYAGDLANISDSIKAREMDRRAEVVDRRLARAQSRYLQALTALAKVRKLINPVVIGQLNVSEKAETLAARQLDNRFTSSTKSRSGANERRLRGRLARDAIRRGSGNCRDG